MSTPEGRYWISGWESDDSDDPDVYVAVTEAAD